MPAAEADRGGYPDAELNDVVAANLRALIAQNKITQKELADKLKITAASMTDYCKGRRLPNIEFLIGLKNLYGISIDEFLTGRFSPARASAQSAAGDVTGENLAVSRKYCGFYYVYYFDTSKYKGRDSLPPREALLYGVLIIYEERSASFGCTAVLGLHDRDAAAVLRRQLESLGKPSPIAEFIGSNYANNAYYGSFDLSQEHAFVSMSHANRDKALIIFHRVDSNKGAYTGGIGTINSVSKGRERMPVVQYIGISRYPLSLSVEEIHHCLLLGQPGFRVDDEADEMIRTLKTLYVTDGVPKQQLSEVQKAVVVKSVLERAVNKSLERNMFRYGKISERDDDDWYHSVKDASVADE